MHPKICCASSLPWSIRTTQPWSPSQDSKIHPVCPLINVSQINPCSHPWICTPWIRASLHQWHRGRQRDRDSSARLLLCVRLSLSVCGSLLLSVAAAVLTGPGPSPRRPSVSRGRIQGHITNPLCASSALYTSSRCKLKVQGSESRFAPRSRPRAGTFSLQLQWVDPGRSRADLQTIQAHSSHVPMRLWFVRPLLLFPFAGSGVTDPRARPEMVQGRTQDSAADPFERRPLLGPVPTLDPAACKSLLLPSPLAGPSSVPCSLNVAGRTQGFR